MLKVKACPHCGGDLIGDSTNGWAVFRCLQCSREWDRNGQSQRRPRPDVPLLGKRARPGQFRKPVTA